MRTLNAVCAAVTSLLLPGGVIADSVSGQGTWESTLQERDLDRNGVADAFYDTTLDITWLRDANVNGKKGWDIANNWANTLVVGGISGWRLPTMIDTGTPGCNFSYSGTDCGYNVQTISANGKTVYSEMAHLYSETLGNISDYDTSGNYGQPGSGLTNTGHFENLQPSAYWSVYYPGIFSVGGWYFDNNGGLQWFDADMGFHAMAVHDGDVAAIPEPETYLLALIGAGLVLMLSRRRNRMVV